VRGVAPVAAVVALLMCGCHSNGSGTNGQTDPTEPTPSNVTDVPTTAGAQQGERRAVHNPCLRVQFKGQTYFLTHRPMGAGPGVGRVLGEGRTSRCEGGAVQERVTVYSVNEQSPDEAITISPPKGDVWLYTRPTGDSSWAHRPRIVVDAGGAGPVRLGMNSADLEAMGANFWAGGAVGGGHCQSFAVTWAGARIRGQVHDQAGVQIIHLDDWGETPEGIGTGDPAHQVAAAYPHDWVSISPGALFATRASREARFVMVFDMTNRPYTVAGVSLIRPDQDCTRL
jgi:hypothetical protein